MPLELVKEKWVGKISEITIGALKEEGGSRTSVVTVGGETGLPFLLSESQMPHRPAIAMEVWDLAPSDWPEEVAKPFKEVMSDPAGWSKKCVNEYGADLICLRLQSAHSDFGNAPADKVSEGVKKVLEAVGVPLIVLGPGQDDRNNEVLPRCSEIAKGERCLFGDATQDNYKTLVVACLADGHNIIGQSPIDINIAKQVNILISDMGFPLEKIVMNPTTGGLGYGLEYTYSVIERARLATLGAGDKTLALPIICRVGQEAWRAKEAKASEKDFPGWGSASERGPMWEATTATALLLAGADILIMRHPRAVENVKETIEELMKK